MPRLNANSRCQRVWSVTIEVISIIRWMGGMRKTVVGFLWRCWEIVVTDRYVHLLLCTLSHAVKIELEKKKAMNIPIAVFDRKTQLIYQEKSDGTCVVVGKRLRKGHYSERSIKETWDCRICRTKQRRGCPAFIRTASRILKEGEGMVFHIPGYENEKIYIKVNNKEGGCWLTMALL